MRKTNEFYQERIEEAAEEARNATLSNVKERALRSEAAWRKMALRADAFEAEKARHSAEAVVEPEG